MQLPKIKADGAIDDHDVYFWGDDGLKAGEGDVYRHNGDRLWPRSGNQMTWAEGRQSRGPKDSET